MKAEELYDKFIKLGNEAVLAMMNNHNLNDNYFQVKNHNPKTGFCYEKDRKRLEQQQEKFKDTFYPQWKNHLKISENLFKNINSTFINLLNASYEENFYFVGASSKIHISKIEKEKENSIKPIEGFFEKHYYKSVIKKYKQFSEYIVWYKDMGFYTYHGFKEQNFFPYLFLNEKNSQIIENNFGSVFSFLDAKLKSDDSQSFAINVPSSEDKISAKQKVLYLNELGIIDFLNSDKNQKMNPTKMSKLLSKITEENPDTLRFSISAILDNNPTKNNPYIDEENVLNTRSQLMKIGYNLKKQAKTT